MASERRQSLIINIQNLQNHPQMIEKRRKARQTFESNLILAGLSIEYEQKNVSRKLQKIFKMPRVKFLLLSNTF